MKQTFAILLEEGEGSWAAHAPDLPKLYAFGNTREDAKQMLSLGIAEHLRATQRSPDIQASRLGLVTTDQQEAWPDKPTMKLEMIERG